MTERPRTTARLLPLLALGLAACLPNPISVSPEGLLALGLFPDGEWRPTTNKAVQEIFVTDLEGRIVLLNEEATKYFRAPQKEILGKNIQSLFEKKESYDRLYDEVVSKKLEIARYKTNLCNPLGECLPSFINANALREELGQLLGIIFIIRDIRG